jgi:hypothetical protein
MTYFLGKPCFVLFAAPLPFRSPLTHRINLGLVIRCRVSDIDGNIASGQSILVHG